jgi:hypothetical protein
LKLEQKRTKEGEGAESLMGLERWKGEGGFLWPGSSHRPQRLESQLAGQQTRNDISLKTHQ